MDVNLWELAKSIWPLANTELFQTSNVNESARCRNVSTILIRTSGVNQAPSYVLCPAGLGGYPLIYCVQVLKRRWL